MIEGDFVQFYEPRWNNRKTNKFYNICNGLNYISDHINLSWVDLREYKKYEPKHEKVYVSVWYGFHQKVIFYWARKYPKCQFVLGGPLYRANQIKYYSDDPVIPENVYFTSELAEEHFDLPINLNNWKLDFPYELYSKQYTYHIGSHCYWHKCTFCSPTGHGRDIKDQRRGYVLEPLLKAPFGSVHLTTPAVTPAMLEEILPVLSRPEYCEHRMFSLYIRSGHAELEVLKRIQKLVNWNRFVFCIGIEFPSDRMLQKMNKGITKQECIDTLIFLKEMHGRITSYYIANWPGIIVEDVKEANEFFKTINLPKSVRINNIWGELYQYQEMKAHRKLKSNVPMTIIKSVLPKLTAEEKRLNQEYIDVLKVNAGFEREENSKERKLPLYDKEALYKKFIAPLENKNK